MVSRHLQKMEYMSELFHEQTSDRVNFTLNSDSYSHIATGTVLSPFCHVFVQLYVTITMAVFSLLNIWFYTATPML